MGWFTRGTARSYDSLSGWGALIGFFTKKVLVYACLNRKCRQCDLGHDPKDHDCRKNFRGSAKAMEPAATEKLVTSPLLKGCNAEVGLIVTDGDSLAIEAARNACDHEIAHQNDKNHVSKGVKGELYKLKQKSKFKDLSTDTISYLHRCFTYCISQNVGDSKSMAEAILNIPEHCFNEHENCGSWCGYLKDPTNYKHANIGEGFEDQQLYEALKGLFGTLAVKSDKYVSGLSSNINENLNHMATSKAPKSRYYGSSTSNDIRNSCTVLKKNEGEVYTKFVANHLGLSPSTHQKKFIDSCTKTADKRAATVATKKAKLRRLGHKAARKRLKLSDESVEDTSYESNIQLLNDVEIQCKPVATIDAALPPAIVYFDLETCNFKKSANTILQIAAKCKNFEPFSIYVRPTKIKIHPEASNIHKIVLADGFLFHNGARVSNVVSLSKAMQHFYDFLYQFERKIILVAHNCAFDRGRIIQAIEQTRMQKYFQSIIFGFVDSLPIIKKNYTKSTEKGANKLENIAKSLDISNENAHNADYDVLMLMQVLEKVGISEHTLISQNMTWEISIKMERINTIYNSNISCNAKKDDLFKYFI